ncbi:hypothetical protein RS030_172647 [Cryptosporidium xiaoi]|uniref:Uncharacterized protein n=1 Tax=Cryptosporidium xiaoi TaxID=659607 RepID=A0AAV9Y058_9CRYT
MSILIVNDINVFEYESLKIIDLVSDSIKKFFLSDQFLKDYSEFLFSVYFAIDDQVKNLLFSSSYFCELYWHPISSSCLNFVSLYNIVSKYILKNTHMINNGNENRSMTGNVENFKTQIKQKSIREIVTDIFRNEIFTEYSHYDDKNILITDKAPLNPESSIKNDNLTIGKNRQLLIMWIISNNNYSTRKRLGCLPKYVELRESSIIPNVEIKYIVLEKNRESVGGYNGDDVIFINSNGFSDVVYNSILNVITRFFSPEMHTIVFSPASTLSEIGHFDDLSLMVSQFYPNISAFPIFIQDTYNNLSLPPFSTIVGVISHKKYQPLPVVTRRLIQLKNSSEGKKEAVKSLIISLHRNKLAIALELNDKWYALLISITIGNNLHLAIDILKPGYIIAEEIN